MIKMKKFAKFLSAIMAFCMLLGTLSVLSVSVFAEETTDGTVNEEETAPVVKNPTSALEMLTTAFASKEEKLASMDFALERYGYKLYVEPISGEVAVVNTKTGDILMTNPYDVGGLNATDDVKNKLFSQIIVNYNSVDGTISQKDLTSFGEAAMLGQITVKNIKNGIRVEYVIGKQETRYIFPDQIEKNRFKDAILAQFPYDPENYDSKTATDEVKTAKFWYDKLTTYFTLKDTEDPDISPSVLEGIIKQYPVLDDPKSGVKGLYVFDSNAGQKEKNTVEFILKTYCPDYTFEQRDYDHELCQYEPEQENPVQFRVALEYYLDEDGLKVRMPANGIRYDQSAYELNKITCLPFMGAGNANNIGYTMFPDGSGTLTRFEDVKENGSSFNFFAMPYGQDYAYHSLKIGKNLMPMRMPVFGLVQEVKSTVTDEETGETSTVTRKEGYFAIIEEGDSLAMVRANHGDRSHPYNYVQTELDPRPKDTYSLNVTSASGNSSFTKVSDRKYTGSFMIRYIMLSDLEYAKNNGIETEGLFDTSYVGMAMAYRYRLIKTGALVDRVDDGDSNIPFYVESLGAMEVQEKVLSIPVDVMKALTTFEDVKTIHKELSEAGVKNLVFKLTGFINGGLKNTLPNRIKAEKVVGGNKGLKDLQKYANDNGFEIYLDTDFSYAKVDEAFDGFERREQAVRTVDDRFVKKKTYSPVLQTFTSTGMMVIAPSSFEDIFEDLEDDAKKLGLKGLSLGTIGSDIASDFDEDEPYHREDSKGQIKDTLAKVREAGYEIMMEGGNAYAVGYATHVLGVPLDSSRRAQASEAIPFFGLVYHGFLSYAGNPTNMAGDIRYETLKLLENGANPYYVLVYRNSEKLKEDTTLSQYFSISYENWKDDIIESYDRLNGILGPVMNSPFVGHEFLIGERVPDADELEADRIAAEKEAADKAAKEEADRLEQEREDKLNDHLGISGDTDSEDVTETPDTDVEVETPAEPEDEGYQYTKYTVDNGMIVRVTFENGYSFILNYNIYDITVVVDGETLTVDELGFLVIKDGEVKYNSAEEVAA